MSEGQIRVRVWDWTVRVFHWALALLVLAMWWTAEQGYMLWHKWIGAGLVALLIYRLVWGFIGPQTARLLGLFPSPQALISYVKSLSRSDHRPSFGHSALGGLAVLALLGLLIAQTVSGLFSIDVNGMHSGWFGHLISFDLGRSFADYHELVFDVLVVMIWIHLAAILAYAVLLKTNLLAPMITGFQARTKKAEQPTSVSAPWLRVGVASAIAITSFVLIVSLGR